MRYNQITERRRNPEQNLKIGIMDVISDYASNTNIVVSFTDINKIGIRPISVVNHEAHTPAGVYAYPADYVASFKHQIELPYAGGSNYANIIEISDDAKVLDLQSVSDEQIKNAREIASKFAQKYKDKLQHDYVPTTKEKDNGSILWKEILFGIFGEFDTRITNYSITLHNALIRECGYDVVKDTKGIIFDYEPVQTIILSPKVIKSVKTIINARNYQDSTGEVRRDKRFDEKLDNDDIALILHTAPWLNYAKFQNADISINGSNLYWHNGTWLSGRWEGGTWVNGTWTNGTWVDGTWRNGEWENGTWLDGTWEKGRWYDGTWKNGNWRNGQWFSGVWENGRWENGQWFRGTWVKGFWLGGTWTNGYVINNKGKKRSAIKPPITMK